MRLQPKTAIIAVTSVCLSIATQTASAQEYVVQPGDTLRSIAAEQLGSVGRWRFLCDLNADRLPSCDLIYSGMTLRLSETAPADDGNTEPPAQDMSEPRDAPEAPAEAEQTGPFADSNVLPAYDLTTAQVGVLGEDGQLPDGWNLGFAGGADGTAEITAATSDHIDILITQTAARGAPLLQFRKLDGTINTRPGDGWVFSVETALLAGGLDGNGRVALSGTERDANGGSLRRIRFQDNLALDADLRRITGDARIENAETRIMNPDLRIISGGPWTAEFRIADPRLEKRQ